MNKLKQFIEKVLKKDDRLWNDDKTDLNETLLIDLVESIDGKVIELLLQEKILREKFFVKIKDVYVFKTNDFRFFIEENKINNSFTDYKNRIGLTDSKKFLRDTNDVVLNFPYKDCVLEGGQSTEEGTDTYFEWQEDKLKDKLDKNGDKVKDGRKNIKEVDVPAHYEEKQGKRKEVFFNQVLAYSEIDRLFDHKALTNWKRFNKNGEQEVKKIKRDETGTIKENLIIKGNNLIALHGLKKQFTGKIKLIYIDPPYNTGNDGFKYNDNFNHSTWLTFMKNRLEVAKELLRDDGIIFVQCDDNEQAYLKVLMDEVFGRNNFINNIVWLNKEGGGKSDSKFFIKKEEYALCYAKKEISLKINQRIMKEDGSYSYHDKYVEERGKYKLIKLNSFSIQYSKSLDYEIELPDGTKILPSENGKKGCWRWGEKQYSWGIKNDFIEFKKNTDGKLWVYTKQYFKLDYQGKPIIRSLPYLTRIDEFSSTTATKEQEKLFGKKLFAYPKPEGYLQRIIELSTNKKDIVLDYHLGSGTTCAVAHKMNRQYIGIEQMDYIENIACERMKKVIKGEQGGISKSVNWQEGGDFIYFELAKWNEIAKEKIQGANNLEELEKFFDTLYEKYFLNYNFKIKNFKEKVIKEDNFRDLSLEEQKKMFIIMLDNNQMYVNKTEMADKKFGIDKKDQQLTENFYNSEK